MIKLVIAFILLVTTTLAHARNDKLKISIEEGITYAKSLGKFNKSIKLYFDKQKHSKIKQNFGKYVTNKKTNAVGKSDLKACKWVFVSALIALQKRAVSLGADAVVNIQSYYKSIPYSSSETFECGAGTFLAGVALRGEFVNLK